MLLNNRLQLSGVAKGVFDDRSTGHQNVLLGPCSRLRFNGEVYPAITQNPATLLGKFDNSTLGLEEEQVLGVRDREGGIGLLRAVCDLAANSTDKDLASTMSVGVSN